MQSGKLFGKDTISLSVGTVHENTSIIKPVRLRVEGTNSPSAESDFVCLKTLN